MSIKKSFGIGVGILFGVSLLMPLAVYAAGQKASASQSTRVPVKIDGGTTVYQHNKLDSVYSADMPQEGLGFGASVSVGVSTTPYLLGVGSGSHKDNGSINDLFGVSGGFFGTKKASAQTGSTTDIPSNNQPLQLSKYVPFNKEDHVTNTISSGSNSNGGSSNVYKLFTNTACIVQIGAFATKDLGFACLKGTIGLSLTSPHKQQTALSFSIPESALTLDPHYLRVKTILQGDDGTGALSKNINGVLNRHVDFGYTPGVFVSMNLCQPLFDESTIIYGGVTLGVDFVRAGSISLLFTPANSNNNDIIIKPTTDLSDAQKDVYELAGVVTQDICDIKLVNNHSHNIYHIGLNAGASYNIAPSVSVSGELSLSRYAGSMRGIYFHASHTHSSTHAGKNSKVAMKWLEDDKANQPLFDTSKAYQQIHIGGHWTLKGSVSLAYKI